MSAAPAQIKVTVRLFAMLRELAGSGSVELQLGADARVADALAKLAEHAALSGALSSIPVVLAVNREYADASTPLAEDDELALIPPLSGGGDGQPSRSRGSDARSLLHTGSDEPSAASAASDGPPPHTATTKPRIHARISEQPLRLRTLAETVSDPRAGAVVLFQGVTRSVAQLSYEAYVEMAAPRIESIAAECAASVGALALAIEHRIGVVPLGEPSVIVAASAPHRAEAFAAARAAIDRVKAEAPIWKQEVDAGGESRWVGGTPPPAADGADRALARLTHVGSDGRSRMVDVGGKPLSERAAVALARVRMSRDTAEAVQRGDGPKGEVLGVARLAGIQAAKQTGVLIPLAHPLPLTFVDVRGSVDVARGLVELEAQARTVARTGVEMEAMTAASVAALTVYDMVKGIERGVSIEEVVLLSKRGGESDYTRRGR
ncbi:MAG: cyclic pyranopterin monophosphate synthase MoaC [Solirubrobacteraceae bacterium]